MLRAEHAGVLSRGGGSEDSAELAEYVGCGSGRALNLMASTFPGSRFFGCDSSDQPLDRAGWNAFQRRLTNAHFDVRDAADLDQPSRLSGRVYDRRHNATLWPSVELRRMPLLESELPLLTREARVEPGRKRRRWKKAGRFQQSTRSLPAAPTHFGTSIALLTAAGISVLNLGCPLSAEVEQPIAFVHKIHVAEEEIPCTECHIGAEEAEHATIPGVAICLDCHEDAMGESAEEAKLVEMLATGEPIPWKRVHKLREHVRFSHRRHVVAGRVLCERCHGEVPELELPFGLPFINFNAELGMERCIACHIESANPRATVDCALCHR